jgi:hypothetical protein
MRVRHDQQLVIGWGGVFKLYDTQLQRQPSAVARLRRRLGLRGRYFIFVGGRFMSRHGSHHPLKQ